MILSGREQQRKEMQPHHGRSTIGVLIGWHLFWTPNPYGYLTPIFRGISAAVNDRGCDLLLACGMGSQTDLSDPTRPAWPTLANDVDFVPVGPWNTHGIIVINPLISETRSRYIHDLMQAGHSVVFVGEGEGEPTVVADNKKGISQALTHLVTKHGHKRIAFIAGNSGDVKGDSGTRLRAYQAGLQQFGLQVDPSLIAYGYHTFEGGYAAMQQILASRAAFTAVLASNDESAMGAMQALKEAGRRIPQDVAIIGFDDRQEAAAQVPPLTSVHVSLYNLGYQAVEVLLQHIYKQKDAAQFFKISTNLAIRQSCGCYPDAGITRVISAQPAQKVDVDQQQTHIVLSMAEAVFAETQRFDNFEEIKQVCEQLLQAFTTSVEKRNPADFQQMIEDLLVQTELANEDVHIWQVVISSLRLGVPLLIKLAHQSTAHQFALDILDQARNAISERMRRQHGRYIIDQKWMTNRVGHLTTRLLMTSNKSQIFEVLADDLPAMGINHTSLSFFEADGDDPIHWSILYTIPNRIPSPLRFPTRQFPPAEFYQTKTTLFLVLVPLVSLAGQIGFIAYESTNIELVGPITQQIAAALNNAKLYAEATEGRKLAEEANKLKSYFLSMVSHELRTPLNLINGLSEILLQKQDVHKQLPDQYHKDIKQIYSSAQHLGRLIRDVLDLASSEIGQLRLENELLDLSETLEMVVATGQQMAKDKGLEWEDSLPSVQPWVWGDRTRLRQVALNLVSNAIKFTSHGKVRLQVEVEANNIVVAVSDTGLGVSPKEQTLIFDEFRRSEQSLVRGYGGLGLGLAISKRLVEMHGGEIGVRSSGEEGVGSTFFFTLPQIEPEVIHKEQLSLPLRSGQTVLLLTGQSGNGERLHNHLLQKGYEVSMVHVDKSGDWLSSVVKTSPGAVVLDMGIAPKQGWNILKLLEENPATQAIPVILYSLNEDQGAMLELDYLTKPIGTVELEQALEYHTLTSDERKTEKVFLIVDDDPATLEMHVRIVQARFEAQHQILKARNGREALKLMQEKQPDLVLLDLMMPELDGFEVLEAMREKPATRDIPVIVLTGQMLTEKEMVRLNRGVATVLGKGLFSVEETLHHIDTALARKHKLGSEAQRLIRRAMAYIHEHYAEQISREDLGRHLGMSGDYLTLCFRREVGMTFIAYLNRYRVKQAKVMLAKSEKSITEIALSVGFSDSAYFSRVFRQHVEVSPSAYRRTFHESVSSERKKGRTNIGSVHIQEIAS